MTKKDKAEKFGNIGLIPVGDYDIERLREASAQREGVKIAIRAVSELAGDIALKNWKLWDSLRERYTLPTDEEAKIWYDPPTKSIMWRKRVDGV